jgi:hypothetical protein
MNNRTFVQLVKLGLLVFVLLYAKKIIDSILKTIGVGNQEEEEKKQHVELTEAHDKINWNHLTADPNQYTAWANGIYSALQSNFWEDEEAIYNIFKHIWNDSDYLMLKYKFGRKLMGVYGFRSYQTMETALRMYLSDQEIQKINNILHSSDKRHVSFRL